MNTYIFVGLALIWILNLYFYWRTLRGLYPNSRYRAYDMLVFTLLLMLLIGRAVAVLGDAGYYFGGSNTMQFLYFWDLDINYLAFIYAPLLAYQFAAFNIERKLSWKGQTGLFLFYGSFLVLTIEVAQLARGIVEVWPTELVLYHLVQQLILLVVVVVIGLQLRRAKQIIPTQLILILLPAAIIILNLAVPALSDTALKATIVSQITLAAVCLVPFLGLPERKQPKRPNPADFRAL